LVVKDAHRAVLPAHDVERPVKRYGGPQADLRWSLENVGYDARAVAAVAALERSVEPSRYVKGFGQGGTISPCAVGARVCPRLNAFANLSPSCLPGSVATLLLRATRRSASTVPHSAAFHADRNRHRRLKARVPRRKLRFSS
jgi:hypothetical protein